MCEGLGWDAAGHTSQWSLEGCGEDVFCFLFLYLDALTAQAPGAYVQVR